MLERPSNRSDQLDRKPGELVRLAGQLVDKAHGLGENAIITSGAEAGCEVGIERGGLVTDYPAERTSI